MERWIPLWIPVSSQAWKQMHPAPHSHGPMDSLFKPVSWVFVTYSWKDHNTGRTPHCRQGQTYLPREDLPGLRERLRCHEGGSAHGVREEGVAALKLVAHAKVRNLDVPIFSNQQVGRFDVPVDDLLVVYWGWDGREGGQENHVRSSMWPTQLRDTGRNLSVLPGSQALPSVPLSNLLNTHSSER